MKIYSCPKCGSDRVRVSRRKDRGRLFRRLLCLHSLRCERCNYSFRGRSIRWRYVLYAKCPKCAGLRLVNWDEKYYFPPWRKRMLVYFGAREQRCERCRHNFVSFRLRWQPKRNGSK